MIPAVDKADLSNYFISYGDLDTMKTQINYATTWEYGGQVYGVPSTATTQGIVYNKKVFEEAGVTELPKTCLLYTSITHGAVCARPEQSRRSNITLA